MSEQETIRVLLVDDEERLVEYLSKQLVKQGFTVTGTFSAEEAVYAASDAHYDVAVVDLKMPEMDGLECQKKLKELQPFIQCVVLTGHGSVQTALESGHQDAFRYLLKPVEYESLAAVIREAYENKLQLQRKSFNEEIADIQRAGLGPRGMRKLIKDLHRFHDNHIG
jgi:two-component system NtrC family response regulator